MTNLIDDETASRFWQERDTAPEAERESRNAALMEWAKAKKAEQRRTQRDEVESGYMDFEGWWGTTGADAAMFNGDEDRQEILNRRYIAHQFDQTPDEQGRFYPTYRDQFLQETFGKSGLSEAETFNLIKGAVESKKATEGAIRELPGVLAKGVLQRAAEGKAFDEVDSWFAFSGWKERHADKLAGLPDGWESAMLDSAVKLHTRTEALIADMAPESKRAMDILMKFTRPEDAADLPEAGRAEVENLAKEFAKLTPEQRDGIYATLTYAAEADGAGQGKWFFEKVGQGLLRGGTNIYDDAAITAEDRNARENLKRLRSGEPVYLGPNNLVRRGDEFFQLGAAEQGAPLREGVPADAPPPLAEEQRTALIEENKQRLKELRVMREIRDLAQGRIDPIKTEMDGVLGSVVQGAYDFSQSAAYTGLAMIPYVGLPAVMGALANSNYLRMIDQYPDMDADAAWTMSLAIAGPQAVVERFQANALIGRSPMLNALMRRMTDVRLPLPVRLGIGYGANVAFQTGQEFVQEAMPVIADQIAAAIREDMPQFDAKKAWGSYLDQGPEIFYSMLWAGLIGTGASTFRELKRNGQFERSLEELEMVGITGEAAQDIAAEQDADKATALFREAWDKRTPEDIQAGISKRAAMLDAAQATQANPDLPTRRVEQAPDGTTTHIIEQNGQTIYSTNDPAAADLALVNFTRMVDRGRITGTTNGIVEALSFFNQVNEAANRGDDVQKFILENTPRNLLDEYEANPTEQNLDNLFKTVRTIGQDISEPAELANFPVLASNQGALAEGIFKSVIRIYEGATGDKVVRDVAQDNLKRAIAEQRITMDWVRDNLNQIIPQIDSERITQKLRTETDTDVIESFSDVALAYMRGNIRDEQIPAGLRGFLRRMAIVVKDIFRRAYKLKRLVAEGKVDANFEALLAESVGLNQQTLVDTTRERVSNEVLTDTNYSIGSKPYPMEDKGKWYANEDFAQRGGRLVTMSPDQFLSQVRPLEVDEASRENIDDLKNMMQSGRKLDPLAIYADGKEDGRHRAIAAKELGITSIPVIDFRQPVSTDTNYSIGRSDEITGLPLNPNGTVTVYHGTTKESAAEIQRTGILKSAGEPDVYFTTAKEGTGYGDGTVVGVEIDPKQLILDDEFPDGRRDFRVNVGKSKRLAVKLSQSAPDWHSSADDFQKHWTDRGVVNSTQIYGGGKYIKPGKIIVGEGNRNSGLGTEFMRDLTAFADSKAMQIRVTPSKDFGATSVDRLKKFYKRFGFVENSGRNKDYEISDTMYRRPSTGATNYSIGKVRADRVAVSDFLNQVRTQSRGKKPISIEIGKLEGAVLENLPEPFRELAGYPIKIDEDLIRKNDNLSKQTQSLQQLRIQIPTDEDYLLLSEFINSANRITQGNKRNDGTSTIEFRNSSDPKVAVTAIRNKAGYLAVVRFVGEEVALPLTEPNEGRQELTPEAAGQDQPATSDGNVNFSIAVPANFISQVSDKDDQFRVGTAKLGTAKVPKDTPQESNISGDIVPDDLLAKQMEKINYAHLPKNILSEIDPKKKRRKLINWFKKNLLALHDAFPEEFRARATHWYDGANRIARELGGKFQASVEQASGVIAVFSPQKDWFMNVAQAEQFMELWANSQDVVLEESLVRAEIEGIIEAATVADKQKRKKTPGETKEQTAERREYNKALDKLEKEKRRKIVEQVIGKTIRELDAEPDLQGWAIRVLAQVTFGRNYRNLSPEGDRLGMATNDDGALAKNGWGSNSEIKKAVRIMKDGSLKNISDNLGNEHKVRNFFNNIVAPNSPFGDATIDTHAVAAAHLMPYGAKAVEVGHNFGANMNSSEVLGISGIYHLYLDAYREAAAERGLQPRQMQSITWEAIRLVYPAANKNAAALAKAEKTWQVLTDANARNSLVGGRTPSPVWAGANDNRESQGVAGGLQKARGRNDSGRGLLSGVRPAGAGRDGVADFSISTPRDIQRVSRAFDDAARSPEERIAIFERAKSRFFSVLSANQKALDDLRGGTVSFRRTQLLQALGELDAILSVFPPDIRGRVGGYTRLAGIAPHDVFKDGEKVSEVSGMKGAIISAWMKEGQNIGQAGKQTALPPGYTAKENLSTARADRAIAEFFKNRIEVLDRELEKTLRREYDEAFQKLLDRTKPKKAKPGEKPKGIGADVQDLFVVVREAVNMSATDVAAHIAGLDAKIASGELTAEQEARAQVEAALVSLVGDWKNASADRRKSAFMEASRIWNGAYAAHAQKVIAKRQQREVARLNAVVATGKAGEMSGRKAKAIRDSGLKGTWKDFFLNLLNFDQVAGVLFGENSEVANTMIDAQRKAENAKEDGSQAKMQELEDFFTQLAGGNLLDGEKLRYDLAQPSMTVQGIKLSQLEGLSAVMMWVQEDGRRHMEGELDELGNPIGAWHYNQAFIDEILNNLSDEALALRSWLLRRYADEYTKINEVYSELNGVNLPQIQFYSPITVQPLSAPTGQVLDPVSGSAMSGASTSPGALRTRGTAIAEPRFQDALQTYISHTLQMEHWKAFAPFVAEANGILRNRDVQNSVEEKGGAEARKVLNAWLDYFAQGGTRDAGAHLALNQGLTNVLGRASQVALIGRISTILIQSTQLGAAMAEMPVKAYLKRMGKLLTGQLGWTDALNSDYIQRRVAQMPPVVQMAMQGLKGAKPAAIQQAGKRLGMLLSGADGLFTAGTYAITYDYHLTKAKELGLAGQEAEDYARNTAERVTDRIAQPTRPGARSLYENTSTNPLARAGWAFASEARKNLALVAYSFAQRDIKTRMRTLAYVVAINSIGASILRSIWRDILDDEDDELFDDKYWSPKRIAMAVATEPFYGFPVLGSVVQEAVYKSFGEYKPAGSLFSVDNAVGPIKRLPEYLSGDFELRDVVRDIDMVVSALGIMHPNIAAAASISHLARDLFNIGDSAVDAVTEE